MKGWSKLKLEIQTENLTNKILLLNSSAQKALDNAQRETGHKVNIGADTLVDLLLLQLGWDVFSLTRKLFQHEIDEMDGGDIVRM